MRRLTSQIEASETYTVVAWRKQHSAETAKLAEWNSWAREASV